MEIREKVSNLVEEKLREPEFQHCFLLEVELPGINRLNVFLDSDTGITFDECRKVSRHVEAQLDEENWMGGKYTIEVSSPGATKPLQLPRQYHKHVGRKLEVKRTDDQPTIEGTLLEVNDAGVILEEKIVRKEGKKKIREKINTEIPFDQIRQAKVKLAFK